MENVCPNCKVSNMHQREDRHGLVSWHKENGEVAVTLGRFLPVRVAVCPNCLHVDLTLDAEALS